MEIYLTLSEVCCNIVFPLVTFLYWWHCFFNFYCWHCGAGLSKKWPAVSLLALGYVIIIISIIIFIIIIITRPWPAFGRQGLVGSSGGYTYHGYTYHGYTSHASPRACGARLGLQLWHGEMTKPLEHSSIPTFLPSSLPTFQHSSLPTFRPSNFLIS